LEEDVVKSILCLVEEAILGKISVLKVQVRLKDGTTYAIVHTSEGNAEENQDGVALASDSKRPSL